MNMIITFHGEGCFKIQTSGVVLVTQALDGDCARLKADIFLQTTDRVADITAGHLIKGPGEYEIKGVEIRGFPHHAYLIVAEDINLAYLGNLTEMAAIIGETKDPDIALITASAEAAEIIKQFHPKIIIAAGGDPKILEKELGLKTEIIDKLTIKKKDLTAEQMETRLISLKS